MKDNDHRYLGLVHIHYLIFEPELSIVKIAVTVSALAVVAF